MRLGIDLGTNSIGWCLYETNDGEISSVMKSGVRIFSDGRDPQSGSSLAVNRRKARSARRRRDRYLRRRSALLLKLTENGLLPADKIEAKKLETADPYELRSIGIQEKLPLFHFGRAIFHLSQRRGFKSNRKTDRADNESGKIRAATARLDQEILTTGSKTLGNLLHNRRKNPEWQNAVPAVRTRQKTTINENSEETTDYEFYPDRKHLETEFDKLWTEQSKHHGSVLTEELREELFNIIFFQRPLKKPKVGVCRYTDEQRLPKAHPLTQRRIIFETVNNLRIISDGRKGRPLTMKERNNVIFCLDNKNPLKSLTSMKITLDALGNNLKLAPGERFTLGSEARDSIACDPVRASLSHPDRFGSKWSSLSEDAQEDIVMRIRDVESEQQHNELVQWLMENHNLEEEKAIQTSVAPLPESYSALGKTATQWILRELEQEVITVSEAVKRCGWHHSVSRTGEILDELPYYGEVLEKQVIPGTDDHNDDEITRFGRISNTTVHIGLNQLRRLVNKIISIYGKPDQIVVEVARDLKNSPKQKKKYEIQAKKNREAAIKRSQKLEELGERDTGSNRNLLRLYEELGDTIPKLCPYSGKPISIKMVFDGSCEIDHILPYSRTLDDSNSNKSLCLREYNRIKANRTPWEVWGDSDSWPIIESNLKNISKSKRWRFAPDAMDRFQKENRFLQRALNDTQYLSRAARAYLDTLYTEGGHVWVIPGRMTAMLRHQWGLDSILSDNENPQKNRADHRHHAIDAAVVGATDYALLQKICKAVGKNEKDGIEKVIANLPKPWESFRTDLGVIIDKTIVSHRTDHGKIDIKSKSSGLDSTTGQLHDETAYGKVDDQSVVSRSEFLKLSRKVIEGDGNKQIRDKALQNALIEATSGTNDKEFKAALQEFSNKPGPFHGIRRVRLIENMTVASRVEISNEEGKTYKIYKGNSNFCFEIWKLPDGKFEALVLTTFQANTGQYQKPHPAAKRLLRLHKRDTVAIETEGELKICVVQKFRTSKSIYLAPHFEANAAARNDDKKDPFKLIQMGLRAAIKSKIRRVFVDEVGNIRDPGPIS